MVCLRITDTVLALLQKAADPAFLDRTLALARCWFERELPVVAALGRRVSTGTACLMSLAVDQF